MKHPLGLLVPSDRYTSQSMSLMSATQSLVFVLIAFQSLIAESWCPDLGQLFNTR